MGLGTIGASIAALLAIVLDIGGLPWFVILVWRDIALGLRSRGRMPAAVGPIIVASPKLTMADLCFGVGWQLTGDDASSACLDAATE